MATDKNSFLLYCDTIHTVKKLTDEQAGKLFKHVLSYVNDENPVAEDIIIEIAFEPIKQSLKRDLKKYEKIKLLRSKAGKASAASKAENKQNSTHVNTIEQTPTNSTVSDSVIVSDSVSVINKENIFENFRKKYPGVKRGFKTEYENFKKKHKDWELILPNFMTALQNQISEKEYKKSKSMFVPEWKNLQTWINQRCWEEETTIVFVKEEKKLLAR